MTERLYEGLFLVNAADATQDWTELESSIRGIIDQNGGVIEHAEKWPEQRLAYDVNGAKRGVYFLTYFRSDSQAVAPIRSDAQLFEKVLRFLVIQEPFLEDEMAKRKEAAARRSAEPAPAAAPQKDSTEAAEEPSAPPESAAPEVIAEDLNVTDEDAPESSPAEVSDIEVSDQGESSDSAIENDSDDKEEEQN